MPNPSGVDTLGLNQGSGVPDVDGTSYEAQTTQDRTAALQAHKTNIQMSLLAAGLAMMAARPGRGRGAGLRGVAEGGLTGLESYEQGEANIAKGQAATAAQRNLQAYRQGELGIRRDTLGLTQQMRDTQAAAETERERHDTLVDKTTTQLRDIEQQNANSNAYRARIEDARTGVENAKDAAEIAPVGRDIVANFRGSNVEKLIPLLPADVVAAMPKKDADAYARDVTTSYSRLAKDPRAPAPRYMAMGDGKIHKVWTDKDGKDHDDIIGPAVVKPGKDNSDLINAAAPGLASPAATPAPSNMPPSPAAPLGTAPKNLWGKTVKVGDKTYKIDDAGNVTPAGGPEGGSPAPGGL